MQKKTAGAAGLLCVLAAATLWGMMGLYVRRFTAAGLSALDTTALRITCGLIFVTVYLALCKRDRFRVRLRDLWIFFGTGVCSLLFFSWCYFASINRTSLSVAGVLLYTSPVFVMLLSALLWKEKITTQKVLSLLLAVTGCAFVSGIVSGHARVDGLGLLLGLGSGFGYALYSIFSRFAIDRKYDFWTILFYTFLFCSVCCLPFADWQTIRPVMTGRWDLIVWMLAMGFFTAFLAYGLYTIGLERMESSRAAIVASLEPAVGTIVGFLFFHEIPTWDSILGIVLVFSAISILSIVPPKRKQSVNNR